MEAKEAVEERDWSSLLPQVLNLIAKNLNDICDFVRFRAVCTAWRSSTPVTNLPPQFPWIKEARVCPDKSGPNLRFYSIPFGKIYTIHSPKSVGKYLLEQQSDGYMFAQPYDDSNQPSLLMNPLNNHEIALPPCDFGRFVHRIWPWNNQKVVHAVCYGSIGYQHLSCHLGQDNWSMLKLLSGYENYIHYYLNSMVFSVERYSGVTEVKDITTGTLAYVIPPVEDYRVYGNEYIVEASDYILRVVRQDRWNTNTLCLKQFDVFCLGVNKNGSRCWVKVDNIGNQALFIDMEHCIVLRANDFVGIKRNCIYFLSIIYQSRCPPLYVVERIDIETGTRESLPCPLEAPERWFVPSLQHLWTE